MQRAAYVPPPLAYAPPAASPYAGFWIRLLAYFIDHIVVNLAAAPFVFILLVPAIMRTMSQIPENGEPTPEMIFAMLSGFSIFFLFALVGQWLYEALLTSSSWQGTVGKRLLRLKVVDENGRRIGFARATGRFFAKYLSAMIMCIGFLMIGFTDRKRGLHDMLAGTLVIKP